MKFFIAGEGPNELGDWHREEVYQPRAGETRRAGPGVVETLLRRVQPGGWEIGGGIAWKNIRKLRPNQPGKAETHNVRAVALKAIEHGCNVLAFCRDRDGDEQRQKDVGAGIDAAKEERGAALAIIGGMAVEKLESWLLALHGRAGSEGIRRPEVELERLGIPPKDTRKMVSFVEGASLERVPPDARSLTQWLDQARRVLRASAERAQDDE